MVEVEVEVVVVVREESWLIEGGELGLGGRGGGRRGEASLCVYWWLF